MISAKLSACSLVAAVKADTCTHLQHQSKKEASRHREYLDRSQTLTCEIDNPRRLSNTFLYSSWSSQFSLPWSLRVSLFLTLGMPNWFASGHKLLFSVTPSLFTVHYVISCNAGLSGHSLFADRFPRLPFLLSLFFTSRGLYAAPPTDLQGYILSVINLIYRGCIRCIAMKGFAIKHERCIPLIRKRTVPWPPHTIIGTCKR